LLAVCLYRTHVIILQTDYFSKKKGLHILQSLSKYTQKLFWVPSNKSLANLHRQKWAQRTNHPTCCLPQQEKTVLGNIVFFELKFNHIHSFFEKSITFVPEKNSRK